MTDATDAALEKALGAYNAETDIDAPAASRHAMIAAIAAYLAALPKGELAERLDDLADRMELASEVFDWGQYVKTLRAAAALLSVPEGFVVVPKEITKEMARALESNFADCLKPSEVHRANWAEAYRNMLSARPDQFAENANCPPAQEGR